jgi:hypothetical protein
MSILAMRVGEDPHGRGLPDSRFASNENRTPGALPGVGKKMVQTP